MVSLKRAFKNLFSNKGLFWDSIIKNFLGFLPDKLYLSLRYKCIMGKWIDWDNPTDFTEKIQWLKIYNRNSEYIKMVDKYEAKRYVSNIIGPEYIIPTVGVWEHPKEIDWDSLPNQFVLKTTHGGGSCGVVICRDKTTFDKESAIKKLEDSLKSDIYTLFREWPYKDVPRKIIAEKYLTQLEHRACQDLSDYKFFCFNGTPKYCQVIRDRSQNETIDFYDMNWEHQEFVGIGDVKKGSIATPRPRQLEKMIEICHSISVGLPFVRIDLYLVDDKIYFGEITFYPASGFGCFNPSRWNRILGEQIVLRSNG